MLAATLLLTALVVDPAAGTLRSEQVARDHDPPLLGAAVARFGTCPAGAGPSRSAWPSGLLVGWLALAGRWAVTRSLRMDWHA